MNVLTVFRKRRKTKHFFWNPKNNQKYQKSSKSSVSQPFFIRSTLSWLKNNVAARLDTIHQLIEVKFWNWRHIYSFFTASRLRTTESWRNHKGFNVGMPLRNKACLFSSKSKWINSTREKILFWTCLSLFLDLFWGLLVLFRPFPAFFRSLFPIS